MVNPKNPFDLEGSMGSEPLELYEGLVELVRGKKLAKIPKGSVKTP